jgi:glycine/D-amino acid oxidase-like deaminating enzyme
MQTSIFAKRARQYPQKTEYKPLPWDEETQALWIHDAYWIDSATYLKRLRQFLEQKQCRFIEARITDSKELEKDYDRIILACGYGSVLLKEIKELNLEGHLTRGQLAELNLQSPPPFALNGKTYLIPKTLSANETTPWIMGSTFEKLPLDTDHFDHKTFDPEARQKLCEQSQALWSSVEPETAQWQIGYRLAGPDHLPYLSKISPKTYVFTGLGSKGLLYSTLLAQKLVERIIGNPGSFHFQIYAAKDAIYR